ASTTGGNSQRGGG
nr:Chain E, ASTTGGNSQRGGG [Porphyromonas gingivalis W83]6SLI_K Chain K, ASTTGGNSQRGGG [Porphyromonas gingivalis W83]